MVGVKVGNKILRSLALEPEADEALRLLSKRLGTPAAQLLRDGLMKVFDEHGVDIWKRETETNPTRRVHRVVRKAKRPTAKK